MSGGRSWLVLPGFLALCLATGTVSGWATAQSVADWFPGLAKPSWNPPAWVFAPVWTALYILMGIAAWLVWRKDFRFAGVRLALNLFLLQLALNAAWPFLFFGLKSPGWGFAGILALLFVLALTVWAFFGQSRLAGVLMVPYLGWVSFATALNAAIWWMN